MTNAITEAKTFDAVVDAINKSNSGIGVEYFGGYDVREGYEMAGQWALQAAEQAGYTEYEDIEAHLAFLIQDGAKFELWDALHHALSLRDS